MNRINFVDGAYPDEDYFNGLQDSIEESDKLTVKSLIGAGIVSGFALSIEGNTATITAGTAYDALGRAVRSEAAVSVDLSEITRPAAGKYKWLSFYVAFARNNYGEVYDVDNEIHELYQDESLSAGVVEGDEGNEASVARPSIGDDICIAELLIDSASAFSSFTQDITNRMRIPTVLNLKNRSLTTVLTICEAAKKTVTFSELGLKDGSYSVFTQILGQVPFARNLGCEVSESGFDLYLYHDAYPYSKPQLGAPAIKVGAHTVGDFFIGGREAVSVKVFIRKEEI